MWYKLSQQIDIGLQNSPSALGPNTGIFAPFAESEKLRKALEAGGILWYARRGGME